MSIVTIQHFHVKNWRQTPVEQPPCQLGSVTSRDIWRLTWVSEWVSECVHHVFLSVHQILMWTCGLDAYVHPLLDKVKRIHRWKESLVCQGNPLPHTHTHTHAHTHTHTHICLYAYTLASHPILPPEPTSGWIFLALHQAHFRRKDILES